MEYKNYKEFQAIVLAAGRGSRMPELTSERPKCLLPVGPYPLLIHIIKLLEASGFKNTLIVVLDTAVKQITSALSKHDLGELGIELIPIAADLCEEWGTADSLRYLFAQQKIRSDVFLITCDLITNGNINDLINTYRKHKASFAGLFFRPVSEGDSCSPGSKSKIKAALKINKYDTTDKDIVVIDPNTSRLVLLASASDFGERVPIKRHLLRRHRQLSIMSDLIDSHCYVMSFKLLQCLDSLESFNTLKGEFLPYIVSKQYTRGTKGSAEILKGLHDYTNDAKIERLVREASSYHNSGKYLHDDLHGDNIRCFAVLAEKEHFAWRINNVANLWQANAKYLGGSEGKIDASAEIKSNHIDNCTFIGSRTKVMEKTTIKRSVIGENCTVRPKTQIINCIVFNNVTFFGSCTAENCIIADNAELGEGCFLRNCVIGANHKIPAKFKANTQLLTKSDEMMEI